jgi:hypothetical protein
MPEIWARRNRHSAKPETGGVRVRARKIIAQLDDSFQNSRLHFAVQSSLHNKE